MEERCKHGMVREWCADCHDKDDLYRVGEHCISGKELREAVKVLTPRQSEVLWMTAQGMTQERIAGCLGIARQVVGKHLKYARKKLKGVLTTRYG